MMIIQPGFTNTAQRAYHRPQAATGQSGGPQETFTPTEQPIQTPSGIQGVRIQDQQSLALKVTLPAGAGLLPAAVALEGTMSQQGVEWKSPQGQAQMGGDGRVYLTLQPNAPAVVFDPNSFEYGLSSPAQGLPTGGWQRERMELVRPTGERRYIFKEQQTQQGHSWTEVNWNGQQLSAQRVTKQAGQQDAINRYINGPETAEMPVAVNPDGSFQVSAPSLVDTAKGNAGRMLLGDVITPFMQQRKQSEGAGTFTSFSGSPNPFPGIQPEPATASAPAPPTPNLEHRWPAGGNQLPGMPTGPVSAPQNGGGGDFLNEALGTVQGWIGGLGGQRQAQPPPIPQNQPWSSQDPVQQLYAKYAQLGPQKVQAALFLADNNPQKADRILGEASR